MTAPRLNALAVCHPHKEILNTLDIDAICNAFVCNEQRRKHFGNYLQVLEVTLYFMNIVILNILTFSQGRGTVYGIRDTHNFEMLPEPLTYIHVYIYSRR